ncbi:N-acetylmuramoyl-L-alanine amidase [Coralloluteibacterium stylophorae]|uniref:N-acetylmuramoyl-L-alanine amidase n=1 Tax=Coralloluteibacterium stylophorae TaxID=1776034 RepID=A0A8J7VSJ1_9GAMM|nr:N-acetylmuramoyl-L-alanine amidase [Coralloluteibacterium stylophorae]MBS7457674.1 N-acetylmuramoyl-L-alanine amidase [Coralloluteibacterium stylophorae]
MKLEAPSVLFVTATMTSPTVSADLGAEGVALMHRRQGFSQIAAHYVIKRDGTVEPGRPLDTPGVLAGPRNTSAIQVLLIGGVNRSLEPTHDFTAAQLSALEGLRLSHALPVEYGRDYPRNPDETFQAGRHGPSAPPA